jgi:hypothetical protein
MSWDGMAGHQETYGPVVQFFAGDGPDVGCNTDGPTAVEQYNV